jgi:hypothetical protein
LFEDVVPTLEAWKAAGRTPAIFSSGSVQAQLQFFSYVQDGQSTKDIKHLFSAHYDTVNAGPKLEKSSYEKICRELNYDVSKVTFFTDNVKGTYLHVLVGSWSICETSHPYTPLHVAALLAWPCTLPHSITPLYPNNQFPTTLSFHVTSSLWRAHVSMTDKSETLTIV